MTILRVVSASFFALVATSSAFAGDGYTPARSAPAPIWQGFYFGAHGGYGTASAGGGLDVSGGLIGAHLGYLFQVGRGVFGVEADVSATNLSEAGSANFGGYSVNASVGVDMLASIRGVGGFDLGNARVYGTAGVAFGSASVTASASGGGYSVSASETLSATGFVYGAGIEFRATPRVAIRAEALRYEFSEVTVAGGSFTTDLSATVGRVGVTMRAHN